MSKAIDRIVMALEHYGAENIKVKGQSDNNFQSLEFDYSGDHYEICADGYMNETWIEAKSNEK